MLNDSPRGGLLSLSQDRDVLGKLPKGFYPTEGLDRSVSTDNLLERVFFTHGNCARKNNETDCKGNSRIGVETFWGAQLEK